jgi:hypothetical protein
MLDCPDKAKDERRGAMRRNEKLEKIAKRNEETWAAIDQIIAAGGFWIPTERHPLELYERTK